MRIPNQDFQSVDKSGRSTETDFKFKKSVQRFINNFDPTRVIKLIIGSPTDDDKGDGSINAEQIYEDGKRVFVQAGEADKGLDHNWVDHGTMSSGTLTVDPIDGYFQKVTLTGSVDIQPAANRVTTCILHITNGSGANGSFSGWTKKDAGPNITTTLNDKFCVLMKFFGSEGADYAISPRQ